MSDLSENKTLTDSHRRLIRLLGLVIGLSLFFAFGVFLSGLLDQRILALMSDFRGKIKQKYGVSTSISNVETGFGRFRLSEVSVGEPAWMVIDRIDLSVSLNPFRGFLKPSSMTLGRAVVKVPMNQDLWPREIRLLYEAVKRRTQANSVATGDEVKGSYSQFIPAQLSVNAARIEVADGDVTKFLGEDLNLDLDIVSKKLSLGARRIQMPEWIDESFLEGDVNFGAKDAISASILGRLAQGESSIWSLSCEIDRALVYGNCQVDARHAPRSLVSPFFRWVGKSFAPSYRGAISFDRAASQNRSNTFKFNLDGQLGDIFIEHPAVAIGAVGPSYLGLKISGEIDIPQKSLKIDRSTLLVSAADQIQGQGVHQNIPLQFDGAIRLEKGDDDGKRRPTGFLNIEIPGVDCQSMLKAVPQSFVPDLSGFRLGGTIKLQVAATLVAGIPEVKIDKRSSFGCEVLSVPEIYSAAYLNGPFNIERSLPDGKIYIPVDPARPYFAAYGEIPPLVRSAFVSSEDAGFFQHQGVELSAILGALERNTEEGRAALGGSTITMQTVKNLFLARDKTISRKVQEIFLAWHLDRALAKERILEIYLNMVEFGPGLYGIGMASQRFFGVSHRELSLKQAIYLASLLPAPVPRYRYFCKGELTPNYERLLRQLLDRMLGLGRISAAQHASAVAEKIEFSRIERESACERRNYAGSESDLELEN